MSWRMSQNFRRPKIGTFPLAPDAKFRAAKIFAIPLAVMRNFSVSSREATRGVRFQIWEIPTFEIPEPEIYFCA